MLSCCRPSAPAILRSLPSCPCGTTPPERVEDALRLSMATGANVVECPGLGDFAKVDEYQKGIAIRQVC